MSYDKQSIRESDIDAMVRALDATGRTYSLTQIGETWERMPIRRLAFADVVVLERMERTADCDTDDVITSHEFTRENEPSEWVTEVMCPE